MMMRAPRDVNRRTAMKINRNCPGSSAKSGLWPRQRPESQFFQRKFAYRPPLRGGTWAPSRGTWAVTRNPTYSPISNPRYGKRKHRFQRNNTTIGNNGNRVVTAQVPLDGAQVPPLRGGL